MGNEIESKAYSIIEEELEDGSCSIKVEFNIHPEVFEELLLNDGEVIFPSGQKLVMKQLNEMNFLEYRNSLQSLRKHFKLSQRLGLKFIEDHDLIFKCST